MKWDYKMIVSEPLYSSPMKGPNITKLIEGSKFFAGKHEPIWNQILEIGDEGWELINVVPTIWDGNTYNIALFFKRPIE